jgi:hypothetical protein
MTDYLLCFPDRDTAIQFGLANGFLEMLDGVPVPSFDKQQVCSIYPIGDWNEDGKWWILFRDAIGIVVQPAWEQYIFWRTSDGPQPESGPQVRWFDL